METDKALATTKPEDMTEEEKLALAEFKKNGCPGLVKIDEAKVFKWFRLYMAGKGYNEIAEITKDKRDLILYIAEKSRWNEKRMTHYGDLSTTMLNKVAQAKLNSVNTVSAIVTGLSRFYGEKFEDYIASNDGDKLMLSLDPKGLEKYYKAVELLDKLVDNQIKKSNAPENPSTVINIGSKTTVTQVDDNTVDIETESDAEAAAQDLLKAMVKYKRSQQNKD